MMAQPEEPVVSGTSSSVVAADDSGYSTGGEESGSNNNAAAADSSSSSSSDNNNNSSSNDPFFFLTDDDDFENVQERIEYIREKQSILQRASAVLHDEEESYNAATARTSTRTPVELQAELDHQDEYTIWGEAKDILRQISSSKDGKTMNETEQVAAANAVVSRPSGVGLNRAGVVKKRPASAVTSSSSSSSSNSSSFLNHAASRGQINLTRVQHVDSLSYDHKTAAPSQMDQQDDMKEQQQLLAKLPTVVFGKGQWMAQALVWMSSASSSSSSSSQQQVVTEEDSDDSYSNNNSSSSSSSNNHDNIVINPQDCRWKVISDPFTCSLGLVPPSNISMQQMSHVTIEEALSFTTEARLVTQPTPPFCVVFVNKAFMQLAGGLKSKESLIGKPVESILLLASSASASFALEQQQQQPQELNTPFAAVATADEQHSQQSMLHCMLSSEDRVVAACRMQVVPVLDRFRRRRLSMSSYSCMSHLMIRVLPSDDNADDDDVDDDATTTQPKRRREQKVVTIAEILPMDLEEQQQNNSTLQQQQQQQQRRRHQEGGRSGGDKQLLLGTIG
jgi:hypothetical protein